MFPGTAGILPATFPMAGRASPGLLVCSVATTQGRRHAKTLRRMRAAASVPISRALLQPLSSAQEGEQEQDKEHDEEDLGDRRRRSGDDAETEDAGDNCDYEEYERVA